MAIEIDMKRKRTYVRKTLQKHYVRENKTKNIKKNDNVVNNILWLIANLTQLCWCY